MKSVDQFNLDSHSLSVFLMVLQENSVSRAAEKLGMSQSAVSHTLERLRRALGDPLFVKSGRGIAPTRYAVKTGPHVRQILDELRSLSAGPPFDPETAQFTFTIAANDYQRDLLLPPLMKILSERAPGIRLQVIPSGIPGPEMLRDDVCDLIITPHAPDTADIIQKGLLTDRMVIFYDPSRRQAPQTLAEYLRSRHVDVLFGTGERTGLENALQARGLSRNVVVAVSNFSGLPEFLRGSDLLASAPGRMKDQLLRGFATAPLPFDYGDVNLLMIWHQRYQTDAGHRWIRNELATVARAIA
ncbi:DNA-binding transcriptional regulator, LysR family [Marinobacter daqiaonensis]|uniref:DNA-binding transcriptional regulator, LysR family n=1 Tax=Marinobacter daqiaonensis TaxID=650891 RepID=A0A1I6I9G2_9GAMM|nr:LysR family transcriptional regulator [Marinobacter daqiaonensis]SFR63343.1 DNA-binding transcriptional regulator, LysR family [Marinobacter daqiaonensis]